MKKLLIGLLALGSISSYAICNVAITESVWQGHENLSRTMIKKISKSLTSKGYNVVDSINDADLELNFDHVSYTGQAGSDCHHMIGAVAVYTTLEGVSRKSIKYKEGSVACAVFPFGRIKRNSMVKKQVESMPDASTVCN